MLQSTEVLLRQLIEQNLSLFLYDDAKFYAERLYYESKSEENIHMLAQCYFRQGKITQAYLILQDGQSMVSNRYLLATCCVQLDKLEEAERALLPYPHCQPQALTHRMISEIPGGAAGLFLLGKICKKGQRKDAAIKYFKLSLEQDSTLWSSLVELGSLGEALDPTNLYGMTLKQACDTLLAKENAATNSCDVPLGGNTFTQNFSGIFDKTRTQESSNKQGSSPSDIYDKKNNQGNMDRQTSLLEGRRLAESGASYIEGSPAISLSLGLSSVSLHIPFATPGSMASNDFLHHVRGSGNSFSKRMGSSNNSMGGTGQSYSMHNVGPMTGNSAHSGLGPGVVNSSVTNMGMSGHSHGRDMSSLGHARGALFDMDSPQSEARSIQHGARVDEASAIMNDTETTHDDRISMTMRSAPFSAGRGSGLLPSSARRGEGADPSFGERDGGRRVSFGPSARLSFSSFGATGSSEDQGDETQRTFDDAVILNQGIDVEHPSKMQKRGEMPLSHGKGMGIADAVSPIAMSATPLQLQEQRSSQPIDRTINGATGDSRKYTDQNDVNSGNVGFPSNPPEAAGGNKIPNDRNGTKETIGADCSIGNTQGIDNKLGLGSGGLDSTNVILAQSDAESLKDGSQCILSVLTIFASAHQLLCFFRCRDAIKLLHRLPARHFRSAHVQHLLGRAHYEINEYAPALLALKEMMRLEPFRIQGTETLSTVLWHLKKDKELCALAQQVVEVDRMSAEAWCVVGNCFSLQREPESAIKFFQRALQIDQNFTYAHTLCGHESAHNEDLDKATQSFRQAILCDDRHYSAWYGLGSIYYRQERYELAEYHFRRALEINGASGVLHCYLGMVLLAQGTNKKSEEAFQVLTKACGVDPKNPQLHFQRAHALISAERYPEALVELELVKELAPREPPVYIILGQVLQKLGRNTEALFHFNAALDLDPKESTTLKMSMEAIGDPENALDLSVSSDDGTEESNSYESLT